MNDIVVYGDRRDPTAPAERIAPSATSGHWRDRYRKGSFRGAAFVTTRGEFAGGRRTVVHEFPGRDEPVNEDMGRRARRFTIECHCIGADYMTARDALLDALEKGGDGLLVDLGPEGRLVIGGGA